VSQLSLFVHINRFNENDPEDVMETEEEFYNIAWGYVRGFFPGAKCRLESDSNTGRKFFTYGSVTGHRTMDSARTVLATFEVEEFDLSVEADVKRYEAMFDEAFEAELELNKKEDW
jgi:hypothetical protein